MNKPLKFLIFTIALFGVFFLFGSKAEAQTVTVTNATGSPTPTTRRAICTIPTLTGDPVDFTAYVTNVNLNSTTGVISWDIGLAYRSCRLEATRAYAIYGSPDICPQSGWYGAAGAVVYDCVKFIGNPIYSGASSLNCFGGTQTNENCTTGIFGSVLVAEQNPGPGHLDAIAMTHQIPNWAAARNSSGSYQIDRQMCQFYKTSASNFNISISNSRCLTMRIDVSWNTQLPNSGNCSYAITGGNIFNPGQTKRVDYTVRNTGQQAWNVNPPPNPDRYRLRDQNATAPWAGAPREININPLSSGVTVGGFGYVLLGGGATSWRQDLTVPASVSPGTYQFNWRIWGDRPGLGMGYLGETCDLAPMTIIVEEPIEKPYFRVYGGDVIAGRQFTDAGVCDSAKITSARIRAFSEPSGGGRIGAGGQFAVSAASTIEGFMSNNMRSNRPTALSFGNYGTGPLTMTTNSGRDASGYTGCVGNLYEIIRGNGNSGFLNPASTQISSTFSDSDDMKFIHDGNMSFEGNITYDGSWSNFDDVKIPIYVVQGNIDIGPDVERLDGLYFATGRVNTCAGSVAECKNRKLTINGAVIANKIELGRLWGDIARSGADEGPGADMPAEVINFAPEVYLALSSIVSSDDIILNGNYDSVVGLPPVL